MSNAWCITLNTLGGVSLNPGGGEYTTELGVNQTRLQTAQRDIQAARRSGRGPVYTGTQIGERTILVTHRITGTGSTHESNLRLLKQHHYSTTFSSRTLVYTDNDSVAKRTTVAAVRLLPISDSLETGAVSAEWVLIDPVDYIETPTSVAAASKSASPATVSVANSGNEYSEQATITLSPTAAKTAANGQKYAWPVTPVNRVPRPLRRWPVDIADKVGSAGWDHAAEVTATRSASDGDDVEVYVNHRRVDRWTWSSGTGTWNNTGTRLWINIDMPPERHWTYRAAGTLSAVATTVPVAYADGEMVNMPDAPFYAAFVNSAGTTVEVVRVTAYNDATGQLTVVRAQRGTSATTWADTSKLYWCPVLIDVVHGWTDAPTPTYINDRNKPMVLESATNNSDNSGWTWVSFMESDVAGQIVRRVPRTGAWYPRLLTDKFGREDMWWGWIPWTAGLGSDAAVATSMCIGAIEQHPVAGHPYADTWEFSSPIGMNDLDFGQTTSTLTFTTDNEARLWTTGIGIDGSEETIRYDENSSATRNPTISRNMYAFRFRIDPFDPKRDSEGVGVIAQFCENTGTFIDNDGFLVDNVAVDFDSTEKPLFAWGSRTNAYQFGRPGSPATLANSDGTSIELDGIVVTLSDTLTIDLDAQTVVVGDGTGRAHVTGGTWFRIPPGTNNLTYTETGIGTVDIGVSSLRSAWI
jgi:hypothetical protein